MPVGKFCVVVPPLRLSLSVALLPSWRSFCVCVAFLDRRCACLSNVMRLSPAIDSCFHEEALGRKRGVGSPCK